MASLDRDLVAGPGRALMAINMATAAAEAKLKHFGGGLQHF